MPNALWKFQELSLIQFDYTNWKGNDYTYVIATEGVSFGQPDRVWYLNGDIVTRDGDPREDMGTTRRRSFIIAGIRNLEVLETTHE